MRSWSDPRSPWGKQLRFEDREFEAMMDEFRFRSGSHCFEPGKGVDVDLVLLKAEGIEADYADLPPGVMGRSIFAPDGTVTVEISRDLCEAATHDVIARRRLRSTIAHECGHIACHRPLFIRDVETYSLFGPSSNSGRDSNDPILCREQGIGDGRYRGEWWEFQANRCMAALLLPRTLIATSVKQRLADGGFVDVRACIARAHGELLIRALSDEYDVSQTAVLYRLQALGFLPTLGQAMLKLDN